MIVGYTLNATRDTYWPVRRAAARYGLHHSRINQLCHDGRVSFRLVGRARYVSLADLDHYQATKRPGGRPRNGAKRAQRLKRASPAKVKRQIETWMAAHPAQAAEVRNANELLQHMTRAGLLLARSSVYRYFDELFPPVAPPPPPPAIPAGLLSVQRVAEDLDLSPKAIAMRVAKGLIAGQEIDGTLYIDSRSLQAFLRGDYPDDQAR